MMLDPRLFESSSIKVNIIYHLLLFISGALICISIYVIYTDFINKSKTKNHYFELNPYGNKNYLYTTLDEMIRESLITYIHVVGGLPGICLQL